LNYGGQEGPVTQADRAPPYRILTRPYQSRQGIKGSVRSIPIYSGRVLKGNIYIESM
jgi:hypothetical protein